jgi:ABC-2 type transport system permease protein
MLIAAISKEFRLVFRDFHSVLVLFAMPAVFIIIMSLAMQDQFAPGKTATFEIRFFNAESNPTSDRIIELLLQSEYFRLKRTNTPNDPQAIKTLLGDSNSAYIHIPSNFARLPDPDTGEYSSVEIWLTPNVDIRTSLLISSVVKEALIRATLPPANGHNGGTDIPISDYIKTGYLYQDDEYSQRPTAVQQSVPAWLIFSMFFVVIPIATTLVTEKQQGTLIRLRAMNVSMNGFLVAKILPYLLINQLQLLLMLLLGIYLVPILGGDKLTISGAWWNLAPISLAIGFSAVSYALLIAVIAKTTEQATSIGGIGNILLGAIGGIMVPKFVMPDYLQKITQVSPMSWGLDGFLDIFLRNGGFRDILPEFIMLTALGLLLLLTALTIFQRQQ